MSQPVIQATPSPQSPAPNPLLDVESIGISFGGLKAVQQFSIRLPRGGLYGLIGPNGAGKTTIFNLLTGVYQTMSGRIVLDSKNLVGLKPHEVAAAGITRTFQNIRLFPGLNVLDNVRLAGQLRAREGLATTLLRTRRYALEEAEIQRKAFDLLGLFGLQNRAFEPADCLSYGYQRYLEIVRALAAEPKVLLLDEPAAGLNSQEKVELAKSIREIRDRFGVAILLIEHDMGLVMDICEQITVLDHGVIIAHGTPTTIQNDPKVIAAYLGSDVSTVEAMSLLVVENLAVFYGAIEALRGISLHVEPGEVVTLIGANGAGKSTTLRTISGLLQPKRGTIKFDGQLIQNWAPHKIVKCGLVQAPEGRKIFANLSVDENLQLGAFLRHDKAAIRADRERALNLFPRIRERLTQMAGTLSGGEQQMLAIARALVARPKLLMLDEPSLGLAPQLVRSIFQVIREINREGTTILLVEQNANMALQVAHRAYVIEVGKIRMEGPAAELAASDEVRKAYLGAH